DRADRPCPHREDIADNPADAGSGALERLDGAGVVVGLDFEGNRQSVTDVDDTGVFFAGANEDLAGLGGKRLKQRATVLIRTMLAPHDGENAELSISRFAAEDTLYLFVLVGREVMLPH